MGWFKTRAEAPVVGRVIVRFTYEPSSRLTYTIDQGESSRTWMMSMQALLTNCNFSTLEEALGNMIPNALNVLQKDVPSLVMGQFRVDIDKSKEPAEVICVTNDAQYLESEWRTVRATALRN